jgi:hypothetical protein
LLAFAFSNLRLRVKTLEFSLRSPFALMVNRPTNTSWLKAAQIENQSKRKCMEQLAADFGGLARSWAAIANAKEEVGARNLS